MFYHHGLKQHPIFVGVFHKPSFYVSFIDLKKKYIYIYIYIIFSYLTIGFASQALISVHNNLMTHLSSDGKFSTLIYLVFTSPQCMEVGPAGVCGALSAKPEELVSNIVLEADPRFKDSRF